MYIYIYIYIYKVAFFRIPLFLIPLWGTVKYRSFPICTTTTTTTTTATATTTNNSNNNHEKKKNKHNNNNNDNDNKHDDNNSLQARGEELGAVVADAVEAELELLEIVIMNNIYLLDCIRICTIIIIIINMYICVYMYIYIYICWHEDR